MSNFTPLVKKEYEFEGDKVWVTFARLKRKDMLKILPLVSSLQNMDDTDPQKKQIATAEVMGGMLNIIPEYVRKIEGLKDTEGNDIAVETVMDEVYFMALASQIVMDILNKSVVLDGGEQGKKP